MERFVDLPALQAHHLSNVGVAGDYATSDFYIAECMARSDEPENRAQILRIRARNHFMRGQYTLALRDTLDGLHLLGVEVNPAPTRREADNMFEEVKNEILAVGFDEILSIPRARDARTDLAIALLNDAGRVVWRVRRLVLLTLSF